MTQEIWRPARGYEGAYEVSDQGRVRSLPGDPSRGRRGGKILKASGRYLAIDLFGTRKGVHVLVAEAFHGPRPIGYEVRHLNGNAHDNRASNLAWGTPAENAQDKRLHGTDWQANKTHCPAGHAYDAKNTRVRRDGARGCKACDRAWKATLPPKKTCECGMSVWRSNLARHRKSASHLSYEASRLVVEVSS
jgi:hypothetical protein